MGNEKEAERISMKMNLIASLLIDLKESFGEKNSLKEKVKYLLKRGIEKDEDIAAILGIKKSHASKEKAILKKGGLE